MSEDRWMHEQTKKSIKHYSKSKKNHLVTTLTVTRGEQGVVKGGVTMVSRLVIKSPSPYHQFLYPSSI